MDTPPEKPVVSRRTLLAQTQETETGEATATTAVAPVDLFELSPCQNVSDVSKTPGLRWRIWLEDHTRLIYFSYVVTPTMRRVAESRLMCVGL